MVSETVSTFDCEMMSKAIQLAQKAILLMSSESRSGMCYLSGG
mgnify:CR=1 FL=1